MDAHFDAHTHAGQAWVSLLVSPGTPHPQHDQHRHPQVHRRKENPSRQRRQARHEKERSKEKERACKIDAEKIERRVDEALEDKNALKLQDDFCPDT